VMMKTSSLVVKTTKNTSTDIWKKDRSHPNTTILDVEDGTACSTRNLLLPFRMFTIMLMGASE
jgi:hypothetical protein